MRVLLALPLLLPLAPADELVFAPAEGATLKRAITLTGEMSIASLKVLIDGVDEERPDVEFGAGWERELVVSDRIEKLRPGAPQALVRSFEKASDVGRIQLEIDGQGLQHVENVDGEGASPLEGEEVRFEWDAAEQDWERSLEEGEEGNELVERLVEDLDLRGFLPAEDVSEGDEWDVEPAALAAILAPGGALGIDVRYPRVPRPMEPIAAGLDPLVATSPERFVGEPQAGSEITATHAGTREVDGRELTVIALELRLVTERDVAEFMRGLLTDLPDFGLSADLASAVLELEVEGTGEILWDTGAGHAAGCELAATGELTLRRECTLQQEGELIELDTHLVLETALKLSVTVD